MPPEPDRRRARGERPRVALVYDAVYPRTKGGGERRFYEIGRRLTDQFDLAYFFYDSPDKTSDQAPGIHRGVGGRRAMYTASGRRSMLHNADFAVRLFKPLLAFDPDLIDCSSVSYAAIPVCSAVGRVSATPLVVTWHEYLGPQWLEYLPSPLSRFAWGAERIAPHLSNANVSVSEFTASRLRAGSRVTALVIPNGIDWQGIQRPRPFREPTDVLFVGRLIKHKGLDLLFDAVELLAATAGPLSLTIVGDGPELGAVQQRAAGLPPGVSITVIPEIESDDELYCRMASAKVLALPSTHEGYGLVVAEAQACGAIPVVLRSPHSAAPDLVDHGRTGLICDAAPAELARSIGSLLASEHFRCELRQNALRISEQRDWGHVARATADLYHQLIGD